MIWESVISGAVPLSLVGLLWRGQSRALDKKVDKEIFDERTNTINKKLDEIKAEQKVTTAAVNQINVTLAKLNGSG